MSLIYHCDGCGRSWVVQSGQPHQMFFGLQLATAIANCADGHECPSPSPAGVKSGR